jgi:hypothetical protein
MPIIPGNRQLAGIAISVDSGGSSSHNISFRAARLILINYIPESMQVQLDSGRDHPPVILKERHALPGLCFARKATEESPF